MANKITYTRGTTYLLTHTFTAPQYLGAKLLFTIKNVANDTDVTDTTNSIITPKTIVMSGSTFPQTTVITISPTDIAATVAPGTYYYSLKVIDSNGGEYLGDSGQFVLKATSTNRTS
jgi:hypothetical protein